MASFVCVSSSPALNTNTKTQTKIQKPKSFVSSVTRRPLTLLSSRTSTTATKATAVTQKSTPATKSLSEILPSVPTVNATVEHVVFLKMQEPKGAEEEFRKTLIQALNSLKCLPGVLYLSSGYVDKLHSPPGDFNFFLHSRHATKFHRDSFMQHPLKFGFSMGFTEGKCDDFMMLDYIHHHSEPLDHPKYGSALRYTFLKLKEELNESQIQSLQEVLETPFPGCVGQPTYGRVIEPIFTVPGTVHDAVKGYNLGMHVGYPSRKEAVDALGTPEAYAQNVQQKLADALVDDSSVFVVEYDIEKVYGSPW